MRTANVREHLYKDLETAKRCARICGSSPFAFAGRRHQRRNKTIASCNDFAGLKIEGVDKSLPVPFTHAKNQIDIFLERSVAEVFQGGLVVSVPAPEDHSRSDSAQQKGIERP